MSEGFNNKISDIKSNIQQFNQDLKQHKIQSGQMQNQFQNETEKLIGDAVSISMECKERLNNVKKDLCLVLNLLGFQKDSKLPKQQRFFSINYSDYLFTSKPTNELNWTEQIEIQLLPPQKGTEIIMELWDQDQSNSVVIDSLQFNIAPIMCNLKDHKNQNEVIKVGLTKNVNQSINIQIFTRGLGIRSWVDSYFYQINRKNQMINRVEESQLNQNQIDESFLLGANRPPSRPSTTQSELQPGGVMIEPMANNSKISNKSKEIRKEQEKKEENLTSNGSQLKQNELESSNVQQVQQGSEQKAVQTEGTKLMGELTNNIQETDILLKELNEFHDEDEIVQPDTARKEDQQKDYAIIAVEGLSVDLTKLPETDLASLADSQFIIVFTDEKQKYLYESVIQQIKDKFIRWDKLNVNIQLHNDQDKTNITIFKTSEQTHEETSIAMITVANNSLITSETQMQTKMKFLTCDQTLLTIHYQQ